MSASITTDDGNPPLTYPDGLPESVAPLGTDAVASGARILFAVLLATGVLLIVGSFANPKQFYHSYLFGYVFALDIALGCEERTVEERRRLDA